MNEQDFELEQESVEVAEETNTTPTTSTVKKPDTQGFIQRGATERVKQAESMASVLGSFDHETARQALDRESSDITTMSAIEHNFDSAVRMDDAGDLVLPEVPNVQNFLSQANEPTRRLYEQSRKGNVAQLELISESYKKDLRRRSMGIGEKIDRDVAYIIGSGLKGVVDFGAGALQGAGMGAGMIIQAIGTLGDEDNDNVLVDLGVLLQDSSVQAMNWWQNTSTSMLKSLDASEAAEAAGEFTQVALPVALTLGSSFLAGKAAAGVVKTAAKNAAKTHAERQVKRIATRYANRAAGRIGIGVGLGYALGERAGYLAKEAEGKSSQEYQDYLRAKTGGQILSDYLWGNIVGATTYYTERLFGSGASMKNLFGSSVKGMTKTVLRRGLEEPATEIIQQTAPDLYDVIRGALGNEERDMSFAELTDNLISKETLKTFIISSVIGGFSGGAEYASARANIVKDYKASLKKVFPDITEKQLDTAGKAFINSVEEGSNKVRQSVMADDQLRNGYGTYHKIVENRINKLMDKSIAQGKELALKEKTPEYQAQFAGSVAQQFVSELYNQAILREVPINEVFNVTKMDVGDDGVLYMYGKEYGKRPLTQFTKDMTPAQWEEAQIAKRAADALQQKEKAQKEEIKKQVEIARKKEREEKEQKKQARVQISRDYLIRRKLESETADKQVPTKSQAELHQATQNAINSFYSWNNLLANIAFDRAKKGEIVLPETLVEQNYDANDFSRAITDELSDLRGESVGERFFDKNDPIRQFARKWLESDEQAKSFTEKSKELVKELVAAEQAESGRSVQLAESELTDTQAIQQARTMAHNEIRRMPEDTARGVLATLRDDLPVEFMNATEIRQILRSELQNFMALQNKDLIEPIAKAPSIEKRQAQIVRRVRMAKPKSFSEKVKVFGISKDMVQKLGLEGELKNILDKNYRFFVRKNGTITNLEEFTADYQRDGESYQGTVNGFLELLEKDLTTKDVYAPEQDDALRKWRERSIRAGKEEEALAADQRDMEIAELTARLQEAGIDTSTMSDDDILTQGRQMREAEMARMDMIDSDIDFDAIPDDMLSYLDYHHSIKEQNDLAEENARLDEVNPEYTGETIEVNGVERTVYNSNGDRIAKSEPALRNFWNWFGDSKVVDKDGRPLVVYHGTDAEFDAFDISKFGQTDSGEFGKGFYFTGSKNYAEEYGSIVMPVYLRITNAYTVQVGSNISEEKTERIKADGYDGIFVLSRPDEYKISNFDSREEYEEAVAEISKSGKYIVETVWKGDDVDEKTYVYSRVEYVAFEPNQIKSTENRGTFSPVDENIYHHTVKDEGLTTTNTIFSVIRNLQNLQNGKAERMLYDTESGNWYLADADEKTHIDIFVEAFKQGNYPQLNNVREAEQFFDENYIADEQTLLSFLVQKYETAESTKYVMEKTLGSDEYTHAYLHDNIVVFARNEYDLQDAKFPIESFDHYKIEQELNGNKKVVLEEKATKQNFYQGEQTKMGQRNLAAWNPLRRSIELFTGANETSIMHELSHFWLDNMMLYSRLESAARDSGFAKVWNNIKKYLNIDDRQERINESQAEKYTSAYMQYIRNTKIAPVVDLGFKGMDEFIGDISLDYFENAKHREADGTITSELEIITPEMVDTFQKLTTTDLNAVRDLVVSLQDREFTDGAIDSQLGEESTPEQMKTAVAKQERETRQKIAEKSTQNAERDSMPTDIPQDSKTMQNAQNRLDKEKSTYEVGTTDEESFAKAREIIAKDRARAEEIVAIDPNGITDGIANSFIALELARQAVANGKNAMPYLEAFANGLSGSGANLRTANLLNTPEFAWAKDMYEASKAKNYAIALRMRPAARNAIMHRSRIAQTFESKLDQYVEELYPQLLQAQTYEEQVKIINEWANNTAKKIGVEPTSEVWGQSVKGTSAKKTEFSKEVVYQKRKLKEFLKSKIGATLTDAEQLKIRQLHTNTIDAMRQLQTNPNDIETAKEFIRKAREYQDYLNALAPVNWANALFSSIPRASMLFRISTQVKNTVGTRLEILLSDLNRQLRYGKDNLISKKDRDAEIKKSMEMFLIGGFSPDVQENFFETPILAWGEKQYTMIQRGGERRGAVFSKERLAQDKADIANYISDNWKSGDGAGKKALVAGRIGVAVAEKMTGKAYDVLAYSDAYMKAIIATHETAKAATFYAQTIGKEKGWTKEQIKEYAEMLFKDARSYIPKTKLGIAIRKQAVEQAKIETFIKNGTISTFANSVRKGINLGKDSGIGTFISPYVSTAANIMQIGIDYTTGWWRRFDGWKEVKQRIYENAKQGKPIDKADMEYLEKGYRGSYGGLFLLTMLALFKGAQALTGEDDTLDYVPPYSQLTPRERAYYKQVNGGKYNAVKIGDIWVSAEYFGGLSNAITNLGTWYHANSIISAAKGMIAETPVIGDLVEQHDKLQQDITYDKGVIDIAMASVLNQAEKYIPGIGKDIYKAIDEERFLYPLVGSSVGFTVSDEAKTVLDVQRESKASYTSISRSKPFNKLSKEDKRKLDDEFNKEYTSEANQWILRNPNATPEQQKKALDAIRKKIREKLKRKYK